MSKLKSMRGRPVTGRAKGNQINVRFNDDTIEMLNYICEKKGLNRTESLEEAIRAQYNLTKFMG